MACKSNHEEYVEIVKSLIKSNPKYKNYDVAVELVLSNDILDKDQKAMALHYFATIYEGLVNIDSKQYTPGQLQKVLNLASELGNTENYLKLVKGFYKVKIESSNTRGGITNTIDKIKNRPVAPSIKDLNDLFTQIEDYLNVTEYETEEDFKNELDNFKNLIVDAIENNPKGTRLNKQNGISLIITKIDGLKHQTKYVDINQLTHLFKNENRKAVFLKTGEVVQAYEEDGNYYLYNGKTTAITNLIPAEDIQNVKPIRSDIVGIENFSNGEIGIQSNVLDSGFSIKPVDPDDTGTVYSRLNKEGINPSNVEIKVVRLTDLGDQRVNELRTIAANEEEYKELANREHETWETPSQIEILKKDKNAKIISVRRPNKADQIAIIGTFKGTTINFNLYNLDNFTIVSADNKTVPFDFNNSEHINLLKERGLISSYGKVRKLKNADIDKLIDTNKKYQEFKAKAIEALSLDPSVDVTELFFDNYSGEVISPVTESSKLSEVITNNKFLSLPVTVYTVDKNNKPIENTKIENFSLPIIFSKTYNNETKKFEYTLKPILGPKQRILGASEEDPTKGEMYNDTVFIENYFDVTQGGQTWNDILDPIFDKEYEIAAVKGKSIYSKFILKLDNGVVTGFQVVDIAETSNDAYSFLGWAYKFANLDYKSEAAVIEFDKTYRFNYYNIKTSPNVALRTNLSSAFGKKLNLEIRSDIGFVTKLSKYTNDKETKKAFNIDITSYHQGLIKRLSELETISIPAILEQYPQLSFNKLDESSRNAFFDELYNIYTSQDDKVSQEVKDFISKVESLSVNFSEAIAKLVDTNIKTNFDKITQEEAANNSTELIDALKEYYNYKNDGNSVNDYDFTKLVRSKLTNSLNVRLPGLTRTGSILERTFVPQINKKQLVISHKGNPKVTESHTYIKPEVVNTPEENTKAKDTADAFVEQLNSGVINNTPVNNAIAEELKDKADTAEAKKQTTPKKNNRQGPVFSVEKEADSTVEQLPTAIKIINNILPQYEINREDLGDIVDLTTINGLVLGAFKNRVIYLNKQLGGAGTLYHEAFHAVFRNLMTSAKREELIQAVLNNKKHASKFTDAAVAQFASDRNYNYDKETTKRVIAEEVLADGFKEYMLNKTEPKGLIAKFFDFLKKLISMFSKYNRTIDNSYDKIRTGGYSKAEIQSGIFEGEYALESIPGVIRHRYDDKGEYYQTQTLDGALNSTQQNDLVNVIVSNILQDYTNNKFDDKFETAVDKLIGIYNIDKFIDLDPSRDTEIKSSLGNMITNYRFMMGARMNPEKYGHTYDENLTDDKELDGIIDDQSVTINGEDVDNTLGQYSKSILKKQVKSAYNSIMNIQIEFDKEEESFDDIISGEVSEEQKDNQDDIKDEVDSSDSSFDEGYGNTDIVKQVKYIRSFLATIEVAKTYTFGKSIFNLPKVVDTNAIFPILLKITAGLSTSNIIPNIKTIGEQLVEDGYFEVGNQIMAIYDRIKSDTGIDENGTPTKNTHLYKMFIEVLHVLELDYTMVDLNIPEKVDQQQLANNIISGNSKHSIKIKDSVLTSDTRSMKDDFVSSMLLAYNNNTPEAVEKHRESYNQLRTIIKNEVLKPFIFTGTGSKELSILNSLTDRLAIALEGIGLSFPKSLIKMSLIGIDVVENEKGISTNRQIQNLYNLHESFINKKKYLEKGFFQSLLSIVDNKMYLPSGNKQGSSFIQYMEDDFTKVVKDDPKARFINILRKSSEYILKYDPNKLQSVIKNAEGKNIYRYAKYNPLLLTAETIKEHGLSKLLEADPYYEFSLKDFMLDNPALGSYLAKVESGEELTEEDLAIATYMRNLNMSMLGGIQQRIGDKLKEGKSFKGLDAKALYLISLASFMSRETILVDDSKTNESITLFKGQFHQLESTSTNFLLNRIYKSYVDASKENTNAKGNLSEEQKAGKKVTKDGYLAIVDDLMGVITQEYNRIKREASTITDKKEMYEKALAEGKPLAEAALLLKYNAKYENGNVITDSSDLRAFKFNRFQKFWSELKAIDPELEKTLYKMAGDGNSISDLSPEALKALRFNLNEFAKTEFKNHLIKLEKHGVIESFTGTIKQVVGEGIPFTDYKSAYLPKTIKIDFKTPTVSELYSSERTEGASSGLENLIFDSFMNNWYNTIVFNQVFDGDLALSTKNDTDYVKRLKKFAAAGSNMKEGYHKVSYTNTIESWVHNKLVQYGPYNSINDIQNDINLIGKDDIKETLLKDFNTKAGKWYPIFDGQSISSLMHQMDMHDSLGRLSPKAKELMIKKHYTSLDFKEIKELEQLRIVNNSKKTVTAGRSLYHKLSEYSIDRTDVSDLVVPEGKTKEEVHQELYDAYSRIYSLRQSNQVGLISGDVQDNQDAETEIKELVLEIHKYFTPKPHRVLLHKLLNSMEYEQIDQMMDTEASKQATLLPLDLNNAPLTPNGHYNLNLSSVQVPNSLKYLQVETSGVKEKAKVGVQKKVLLPADIPLLIQQLNGKKDDLSATEKESLRLLGEYFNEYNDTLKKNAQARFQYLKKVVRKDGNLDVLKMYKLIQESLVSQNAPIDQIKLFDLKGDETTGFRPAINPNLPLVRKMVEYFFFNHYSQHVTDEKSAGFKSFHISGYGWNVLVDDNNQVISSDKYNKNPLVYSNYKSRPLGITTEVDPKTGITTYWTEVIIPMPNFENEEYKQFYMDKMRKAFGTRIPTEDKRSMIALKIVDFMDSSKLNSVIVPQYVHILAGSDFDIDSLFGQMYNTYKNAVGNYVKYGDTSMYQNKEAGEFVEFLHYMESKPEFKDIIRKKRQALYEDSKENFYSEDQLEVLDFDDKSPLVTLLKEAYGFSQDDLDNLRDLQFQVEDMKTLSAEIEKLHQEKELAKDEAFNPEKELTLKELKERHQKIKELQKSKFALVHDIKEIKKQTQTSNKMLDYIYAYKPIIEALSEFAVPITYDSYKKDPLIAQMVPARYQNLNLDASLKMLSNEHVFKNLYIMEKTSDEIFDAILKDGYGTSVEELIEKGDINTVDSVVESKTDTSSFKDGIGISANVNKFLSIASTYQLTLNDGNVIWSFNRPKKDFNGKTIGYDKIHKNAFHKLNDKGQRAIQIIGAMLGVFADAAKKPIPTALQLNETNTQVALSMMALGLDPAMVIGFGFIPEIRNAVDRVTEAKQAITEDYQQEAVWFNKAVMNEAEKILAVDNNAEFKKGNVFFNELVSSGLLDLGSKPQVTDYEIDSSKLVIEFDYPGTINATKLKDNKLDLNEIGFKVSVLGGKAELSQEVQKAVLLKLYANQVNQLWSIKKVGSLTSFHKKINPNLESFDRLKAAYDYMKTEDGEVKQTIFTKESLQKLIGGVILDDNGNVLTEGEDTVYSTAIDTINDMNEQLSILFLERQSRFNPVVGLFKPIFNDKSQISNIFVGSLASKAYLTSILNANPEEFEYDIQKENLIAEQQIIKDLMNPSNLFNDKFIIEVNAMKKLYPGNKFLQQLKPYSGKSVVKVNDNGKEHYEKERNISIAEKIKLKGEILADVKNDLVSLYNSGSIEEKRFVKKLFWNEIIRTGGQITKIKGSYLNLFPQKLLEQYSEQLDNILSIMNNANRIFELGKNSFFVNGETFTSRKKAEKYLEKNTISINESLAAKLGSSYNEVIEETAEHLAKNAISDPGNTSITKNNTVSIFIGDDSGKFNDSKFAAEALVASKNTLAESEDYTEPSTQVQPTNAQEVFQSIISPAPNSSADIDAIIKTSFTNNKGFSVLPEVGIMVKPNALNQEQINYFLDLIKSAENDAFYANVAKNANVMLVPEGKMWDQKQHYMPGGIYADKNPIESKNTKVEKTSAYSYYETDKEGNILKPVSEKTLKILSEIFGDNLHNIIDATIGNVYFRGTAIGLHKDTTEPDNNIGVYGIVLGNSYDLQVTTQETNNSKYGAGAGTEITMEMTQGTAYKFGLNDDKGNITGRFITHRPVGNSKTDIKSNGIPLPELNLPEVKKGRYKQTSTVIPATTVNQYGLSITYRSVVEKNNIPNGQIQSDYNKPASVEAVSILLKESPELAKIGTVEQYSQYLSTIFPNSKVKDIVYRGGEKNDTRLFQYFTKNSNEAYMYSKAHVSKGGNISERNPITAIDNSSSVYFNNKYGKNTYESLIIDKNFENNFWQDNAVQISEEEYSLSELDQKELENLKSLYSKKEEILKTLSKEDIKLLEDIKTVKDKYDFVKIESESDLTKPYDDTNYQENIEEYTIARKNIDKIIGIKNIRDNIGNIQTVLINITNPYKEEIVQEDLENNRDAYKNGHDGAFLMDGDHFVVKSNTEQIYELGGTQDIEGFKKFVKEQKTSIQPTARVNTVTTNKKAEKLERILDELEYVFGVTVNRDIFRTPNPKYKDSYLNTKFNLDNVNHHTGIGKTFNVDVAGNSYRKASVVSDAIGGKVKTYGTGDEKEHFIEFPVVIKIGRDYYQLKKVDGSSIAERMVDVNIGKYASYDKLDTTVLTSTSNLIAWNKENIVEYSNLINGLKSINLERSVEEVAAGTQTEITIPAPEFDEFKQNVIEEVEKLITEAPSKRQNILKDIEMIKLSSAFIGNKVPETSSTYISATEKYQKAWGDYANPASFEGIDSVMISGSGTWNPGQDGNKITMEQISNHFNNFYKLLIDQAIQDGVTIFNIGKASGIDKLATDYINSQKGFFVNDVGKFVILSKEVIQDETFYENKPNTPKTVVTQGTVHYVKDIDTAKELHNQGIGFYSMRVSEKQFNAGFAPKGLSHKTHFGNPWTPSKEIADKYNLIYVEGTDIGGQAVQNYEDWLDGKAHQEVEPERRAFILKAINLLKQKGGRSIVYHSQGYRSHADVLDERVNGAKSKKTIKTEGEKLINSQDVDFFNSYITKSNGKYPQSFFTSNTMLKEFYNPELGKRVGIPQSSKWFLNGNGLYDLTDQETGEVYIENVDLKTGKRMEVTLASEERTAEKSLIIPYTPKGKTRQEYILKGKQIFNKEGKEVFKSESVDRNKIFANLAVLQGRAVIVKISDADYLVNNRNSVMSVTSGKIMQKKDIVTKAIQAADIKRTEMVKGNPNSLQQPNQEDINNCNG